MVAVHGGGAWYPGTWPSHWPNWLSVPITFRAAIIRQRLNLNFFLYWVKPVNWINVWVCTQLMDGMQLMQLIKLIHACKQTFTLGTSSPGVLSAASG